MLKIFPLHPIYKEREISDRLWRAYFQETEFLKYAFYYLYLLERKIIMMTIPGIATEFKAAGTYARKDWMQNEDVGEFKDMLLSAMGNDPDKKAPYSYLAKDGIIEYNGVTFVCDYEHNALCLGDVSNPKDVIYVALEKGGTLQVNRDNIGDLSKAIGMFSPEDVNRILRAISKDAQCKRNLLEIDEAKNSIGEAEEKE